MTDHTIDIGDRVRCYDFPGRSDVDYVEGVIIDLGFPERVQGTPRWYVAVEREVVRG